MRALSQQRHPFLKGRAPFGVLVAKQGEPDIQIAIKQGAPAQELRGGDREGGVGGDREAAPIWVGRAQFNGAVGGLFRVSVRHVVRVRP